MQGIEGETSASLGKFGQGGNRTFGGLPQEPKDSQRVISQAFSMCWAFITAAYIFSPLPDT